MTSDETKTSEKQALNKCIAKFVTILYKLRKQHYYATHLTTAKHKRLTTDLTTCDKQQQKIEQKRRMRYLRVCSCAVGSYTKIEQRLWRHKKEM